VTCVPDAFPDVVVTWPPVTLLPPPADPTAAGPPPAPGVSTTPGEGVPPSPPLDVDGLFWPAVGPATVVPQPARSTAAATGSRRMTFRIVHNCPTAPDCGLCGCCQVVAPLLFESPIVGVEPPARMHAVTLILRGGRVLDPQSGLDAVADLVVRDGRIDAVGPANVPEATVVDVA